MARRPASREGDAAYSIDALRYDHAERAKMEGASQGAYDSASANRGLAWADRGRDYRRRDRRDSRKPVESRLRAGSLTGQGSFAAPVMVLVAVGVTAESP